MIVNHISHLTATSVSKIVQDLPCPDVPPSDFMGDQPHPAPAAPWGRPRRDRWSAGPGDRLTVVGPLRHKLRLSAHFAHLPLHRAIFTTWTFPSLPGHLPKSDHPHSSTFQSCLIMLHLHWQKYIKIHRECIEFRVLKGCNKEESRTKTASKMSSAQLWRLHHRHGHVALKGNSKSIEKNLFFILVILTYS